MITVLFRGHLDVTEFDAEKVHFDHIERVFTLHTEGETVALIPSDEVLWIKVEQEAEVAA